MQPASSRLALYLPYLAIAGVFLSVPLEALVNIVRSISPTGNVQDKTVVLLSLLKVVLPLFCSLCISLLLLPRVRYLIVGSIKRLVYLRGSFSAVVIIALLVRVAWVLLFPTRPFADSEWYFRNASELAQGYGFVYDITSRRPLAAWPIGYPAILSMFFFFTGPSEIVAKIINVILSTLCVILTYKLGSLAFDRVIGFLAAVILAFFPGVIVYSSLICTDLLFMFLVLSSLFLVLNNSQKADVGVHKSFLLGLFFGFTSLVRATGLILLPIWIIFKLLLLKDLKKIQHWLLMLAVGGILIISPWTIRNYYHFGEFIPVSTNGGQNFWIGNNPLSTGGYIFPKDTTNPLYPLIGTETVIDRKGYELGLDFIRSRPMAAIKLIPAKLIYLYSSNDFGMHWNKLSSITPNLSIVSPTIFAIVNLYYIFFALLAILGFFVIISMRRQATFLQWSGIIFILYWTLTLIPYFGQDRFTLPVLPIMSIYSVVGIRAIIGNTSQAAMRNARRSMLQ